MLRQKQAPNGGVVIDDPVCLMQFGGCQAVGDGDDLHPCRFSCADSGSGVFNHTKILGLQLHELGGPQEYVRCRFASHDILYADDGREKGTKVFEFEDHIDDRVQ